MHPQCVWPLFDRMFNSTGIRSGGRVTWVNQWENMLTSSSKVKMAVKALSRSCRSREPSRGASRCVEVLPGALAGHTRADDQPKWARRLVKTHTILTPADRSKHRFRLAHAHPGDLPDV